MYHPQSKVTSRGQTQRSSRCMTDAQCRQVRKAVRNVLRGAEAGSGGKLGAAGKRSEANTRHTWTRRGNCGETGKLNRDVAGRRSIEGAPQTGGESGVEVRGWRRSSAG